MKTDNEIVLKKMEAIMDECVAFLQVRDNAPAGSPEIWTAWHKFQAVVKRQLTNES